MKCKLKTLKGEAFEVDAEGDTLVKAVKEMAASSEHGVKGGWEVEGIKLIFQGKVLEDTKDLAHYSIGDGDFMVVMASKPKKPVTTPTPPAANEPAAAAPAAVDSASSPAPAPAPAPAVTPASTNRSEFSAEAQAAIDNLVDMGYARPDVQAAMLAAFMNPDRAVQYLEEGLPSMMDADDGPDDADESPPSTWEELAASPSFRAEVAGIRDQAALQAYVTGLQSTDPNKLRLIQSNPEAFAAMLNQAQAQAASGGAPAPAAPTAAPLPFGNAAPSPGGGGGGGVPPGLQQMLANPQMMESLMQNPEMLQQLLQVPEVQQMLQTPEVMEQLGVNPEMMQAMLQGVMGIGPGMGAAGAVQAQLNEEDEEAIQRLMALGFPRGVVIQAFLACDKNENLAANFLFDQGADLM